MGPKKPGEDHYTKVGNEGFKTTKGGFTGLSHCRTTMFVCLVPRGAIQRSEQGFMTRRLICN